MKGATEAEEEEEGGEEGAARDFLVAFLAGAAAG